MNNTKIKKEDLQTNEARQELGLALSDMLQGIAKDWSLSRATIASILHIPEATVKGWLHEQKGKVHVGTIVDNNLQAVIDFIGLYNLAASFFIKTSDQTSWFKSPSPRYGDTSPMEKIISGDAHALHQVKSALEWTANP